MSFYRRLARGLVRGARWAVFNGTIRVINGRVLAYVHVRSDGAAWVVVPRRFCPGLRRELRREVERELGRVGVLSLYRRLVEEHLFEVFEGLGDVRVRGHAAVVGGSLVKAELVGDTLVVSVVGGSFALCLGFPLGSEDVLALEGPEGEALVVLEGDAADLARLLAWRLGEEGLVPGLSSSGF